MAPPDNSAEDDFSKIAKEIPAAAQAEAKRGKAKKPSKQSIEEEQLFGHRRQIRKVWHVIKLAYLIIFALVVLLSVSVLELVCTRSLSLAHE